MEDRKFNIYNMYTRKIDYSLSIDDLIRIKNYQTGDDEIFRFIGVIDEDSEIPLDENVIYLRSSNNKYYKKKATSLDKLKELLPKEQIMEKIPEPSDYSNNDDLIDTTIRDNDNTLSITMKLYMREIKMTKNQFKNLFKDKPSEVSNTFRKIEDGSLSWNRFVDLCERLGLNHKLRLETHEYNENYNKDLFYINKKDTKSYTYEIFTDAGFNIQNNSSSYAYLISKKLTGDEKPGRLILQGSGEVESNSNSYSELLAVIKALKELNKNIQICSNDKIVLYTDAQYIVNSMQKYIEIWQSRNWRKSHGGEVAHKEQFIQILNILQNIPTKVEWVWIRRKSLPQNIKVDKMCDEILEN